jgi:hypothetical protein
MDTLTRNAELLVWSSKFFQKIIYVYRNHSSSPSLSKYITGNTTHAVVKNALLVKDPIIH